VVSFADRGFIEKKKEAGGNRWAREGGVKLTRFAALKLWGWGGRWKDFQETVSTSGSLLSLREKGDPCSEVSPARPHEEGKDSRKAKYEEKGKIFLLLARRGQKRQWLPQTSQGGKNMN